MWLYLCVCLWWRRPQREAHCLRKESLSKAAAVCTHTHTNTHKISQKRDEGRSDRAALSVNLSAVYRSAFSYETLSSIILRHFLVRFLPPLAGEDLRKATYPDMYVNGSEDRGAVCVMSNNMVSREFFLWNGRNPSHAKILPIWTTCFTAPIIY